MALPNLFIIGAMRSGTTSLHNYLSSHSDIFMSKPKELWYFVEEKNWNKGESWYLNHFTNISNEMYLGESSADYTMYPTYKNVPKKIYNFNPSARLIYLMRDPVDRAISHYWYDVRTGFEKRTIYDSVFSEKKYIHYSNYLMQLEEYFNYFTDYQIYIDTFENLKVNPVLVVQKILYWLGINLDDWDKNSCHSYNTTPDIVEKVRGSGVLHGIRHTRIWERIQPICPQFLLRAGKAFAYTKINRKHNTPPEVIEYLQSNLLECTYHLEVMLKHNFSEWTSLYS